MHFAEDVFDVAGVDGGGLDLNEDLARCGNGFWDVLNRQEIEGASFFKSQGVHNVMRLNRNVGEVQGSSYGRGAWCVLRKGKLCEFAGVLGRQDS